MKMGMNIYIVMMTTVMSIAGIIILILIPMILRR